MSAASSRQRQNQSKRDEVCHLCPCSPCPTSDAFFTASSVGELFLARTFVFCFLSPRKTKWEDLSCFQFNFLLTFVPFGLHSSVTNNHLIHRYEITGIDSNALGTRQSGESWRPTSTKRGIIPPVPIGLERPLPVPCLP